MKKIHKTLAIEDPTGDDNVYSKTEQALNNYFMPKKTLSMKSSTLGKKNKNYQNH